SAEGFSENLALVAIEYSAVIAVALWEFFQNKKQDSCATENREVITN
ncbi:MAG: hypothetical protein ACI8RH_001507, partial [Flavobacteriales bacterium]